MAAPNAFLLEQARGEPRGAPRQRADVIGARGYQWDALANKAILFDAESAPRELSRAGKLDGDQLRSPRA